jgi:hypothetical protein
MSLRWNRWGRWFFCVERSIGEKGCDEQLLNWDGRFVVSPLVCSAKLSLWRITVTIALFLLKKQGICNSEYQSCSRNQEVEIQSIRVLLVFTKSGIFLYTDQKYCKICLKVKFQRKIQKTAYCWKLDAKRSFEIVCGRQISFNFFIKTGSS